MKQAVKTKQSPERPEVEYLASFSSTNGVDTLFVFRAGDNVVGVRVDSQRRITVDLHHLTLDAARLLLEGVNERCNAEKK